jgi:hypothetical protein
MASEDGQGPLDAVRNLISFYEREHAVEHHGVYPVCSKLGGLGLACSSDLYAGDCFLKIPARCLIRGGGQYLWADIAGKCGGMDFPVEDRDYAVAQLNLCCSLLDAQSRVSSTSTEDQTSLLAAYLRSLPCVSIGPNSHPCFVEHRDVPLHLRPHHKKSSDVLRATEAVLSSRYSHEMIQWAFYMTCTRSMFISRTQWCLCPIADFLNHSSDARSQCGFNTMTQCYEFRLLYDLPAHEEILINYGPKLNFHDYLFHFGFCNTRCQDICIELPQGKIFTGRKLSPELESSLKRMGKSSTKLIQNLLHECQKKTVNHDMNLFLTLQYKLLSMQTDSSYVFAAEK